MDKNRKPLTVIDLFSGCGGMSWGLHRSGFKVIAGIDNWKPCLKTFEANHPGARAIEGDMVNFPPEELIKDLGMQQGELDCLVGGPPCQSFSKNVPAAYRFFDDPRNHLFRYYIKFVEIFRPKAVMMENVAEIYNAHGGKIREEIIASLEKLGYKVNVSVVFAPDYGVPQRRRRCFFFASRTKIDPIFPEPLFGKQEELTLLGRKEAYRSAWSAISDLPIVENGGGAEIMDYDDSPQNPFQEAMRRDADKLYNHLARKLNEKQYARVASLKPGQALKDLPAHLRPKSGFSGAYGRLDFEKVAPTVTRWVFHPGSGRYCHPREDRLLTTREAARLQSFSDDFVFKGTFIEMAHQIGNAVPPLLMETFSQNIKLCCLGDQ